MIQYLKTEGQFKAEAFKPDNGWLMRSKDKGTPYVQVGLRVVDDVEENDKVAFWAGWLSDKAIENTIQTLVDCFGFNGDLNGLHSGAQSFDGMACEFTAEFEEYNGKTRLKVKWLNAAGRSRSAPALADDDAKAILAAVGKKAKAIAVEAKAAAPKAAEKPAGPEDDVPF